MTNEDRVMEYTKEICLLQAKESLSAEELNQVEELLFQLNKLTYASAKNKYEAFLKSLNMSEFDQFLGMLTVPSGCEPVHKQIYKEKEVEYNLLCDKIVSIGSLLRRF